MEKFFGSFETEFGARYSVKQISADKYIAQRKFSVGGNLLQNSFEPNIVITVQKCDSGLNVEFTFAYGMAVRILFRLAALLLLFFAFLLLELYKAQTLHIMQFVFGNGMIAFAIFFVMFLNGKSKKGSERRIDEELMRQFVTN